MAEAKEVKSAEEATEIAKTFIRKHFAFFRPLKAVLGDGVWVVEIDVGLFNVQIAKVKIDAKTAVILEYELPQ